MGVVQRQSIKYSLVNWVGVLLGAFSTLFIYPHALGEYGLIRFMLDNCTLVYPVLALGVNAIVIRFFPAVEQKDNKHNGFLGLLLLWGLSGYVFFMLITLVFWDQIFAFYAGRDDLYRDYLWLFFPISFLTILNQIFNLYSVNFKRIVIPSILSDFSQKLLLPILVFAYWKQWISLDFLFNGIIAYLVFAAIGFVFYIIHLKAWTVVPNFKFYNKTMMRQMGSYALFGIISGVGYPLITRLDAWMVSTYIGLKSNGVYSIAAFIASVMEVPMRAIVGISIPLLTKFWYEDKKADINELYHKASINLLLMGLFIFGSFWVSVDPFFLIVANGKELQAGKYVILILGIAKLFDMATGINNHVLMYSKQYRFSYIQFVLPAALSIGLCFWLIPGMGMIGAAISTFFATLAYNLISLSLNWYLFKTQPFSVNTLKAVGLALCCYGLVWLIPLIGNPYLSVLIKSGLFALLFGSGVLKLKLSTDANALLEKKFPRWFKGK